jgi:2-dehydropantoate 2-reductase
MRLIVYGIGAIGGSVAAALARAGHDVVGIARGAHLDAVRADGLLLRTLDRAERVRFPVVGDPAEIALGPDDLILLTMKTQDTPAALDRLRDAGVTGQPVLCVQNAVANERMALRRFPNVHGVTVMMPGSFVTPGEVVASGGPRLGIFDIGRAPSGSDADDARLAAALGSANIAGFVTPDVMAGKYGKLLLNLHNIVEAALGPEADTARIDAVLRAEGEAALAAAGIVWRDVGAGDPRRAELMRDRPVPGFARPGGSSTQSLARGAGSIETDWLNGEIVLLGRLHGVPTPANAWFQALSRRLLADDARPGALRLAEVEAGLAAAGAGL